MLSTCSFLLLRRTVLHIHIYIYVYIVSVSICIYIRVVQYRKEEKVGERAVIVLESRVDIARCFGRESGRL